MGFWKTLKKTSKGTHDKIISDLRLNSKSGKTVATIAGGLVVPPGAKDAFEVGKKTAKHSKKPSDVLGNMVRYSTRQANKEGEIIGTMGNYMVLLGTVTGQPELVALGEGMEDIEAGVVVATAGGEDLATSIDDVLKGDWEQATVALGNAVKDYGIAIADQLSDGEMSHALTVAEDIMEGDYSSAKKEAAKALLDAVAVEMHASHLKGELQASVNAAVTLSSQGQKNSSSDMMGGQAAQQSTMSDPSSVFSADKLPTSDDLPGGAARAEATLPAGEPSPTDETVTAARKEVEKKAAVNQNLDDEITMCGGSAVALGRRNESEDMFTLDRKTGVSVHGMAGPYKIREHKRSYSAVGVTPVQYDNAGVSIANRMDIPVKVARVTSMVHENPIKNKLKNRPTVRGFTANYTTKPRHAAQKGDARGDLVKYADTLRALKGTIQKDETDFERDKSMVGFLKTVPEESLLIDAKGPMKSMTRSRMLTRSMRKHEREMSSVLKSKGV